MRMAHRWSGLQGYSGPLVEAELRVGLKLARTVGFLVLISVAPASRRHLCSGQVGKMA